MAGSNRWADILRIIGRSLDNDDAKDVQISSGEGLEIAWKKNGAAHKSSYGQLDMEKLREQAPLMRQPVSGPPKGEREELLRTLGQELDDQNVKATTITERNAFFEVHGSSDEGDIYRVYSLRELRQLSERRRKARGAGQPESSQSASV